MCVWGTQQSAATGEIHDKRVVVNALKENHRITCYNLYQNGSVLKLGTRKM